MGQNEGDSTQDDESARTEVLAFLRTDDVARLDHAAARRGITREKIVAEAVDAFLAREMWSGGFIAPPPQMEIPGPFPWRQGAFRLHRPKTER